MMPPELSIRWGGGKWPNCDRRAVKPTVEAAAQLAVEGFRLFGVELNQLRTASIWQRGHNYPIDGENESPEEIELNFLTRDIKYKKIARKIAGVTLTTFHELVHAVRCEYFPSESFMIEHAATEGLAYGFETLFARYLLKPDEYFDYLDFAMFEPAHRFNPLKEEFLLDTATFDITGDNYIFDRWFDVNRHYGILPPAALIGTYHVGEHIDDGATLPDLMQMPAEEILKL